MDDPRNAGAHTASGTEALTETLEELSEPLDQPEAEAKPLPPGTTLAPEDEEPFTVIRLLKEGFPLRLYEARQDDDEETRLALGESRRECLALNGRRESPSRSSLPDVSPGPGKLYP